MTSGENGPWQKRYETGAARDRQQSAAWVQNRFGGSAGSTLIKELPLLAIVGLVGLFTLGWQAAVINVVLLLVVIFAFRAWARRRYGIGSQRGNAGPSDPA